jgi:hypothetical protein
MQALQHRDACHGLRQVAKYFSLADADSIAAMQGRISMATKIVKISKLCNF